QEVFNLISRLSDKVSSGPDGLPSFLIKRCIFSIAAPIYYIFSMSIREGTFPSIWKRSYITPIFKNGDRDDIENYRGVCNQSVLPKLLDQIIATQLAKMCKHFISTQQHGFISHRSTVSNLLEY